LKSPELSPNTPAEMIATLSTFYPKQDAIKAVNLSLSAKTRFPFKMAHQYCQMWEEARTASAVPYFDAELWEREWTAKKQAVLDAERDAVIRLRARCTAFIDRVRLEQNSRIAEEAEGW
jgi:hypothetical protein